MRQAILSESLFEMILEVNMTPVEALVDESVMTVRLVLPGKITELSRGPAVCLSGKSGVPRKKQIESVS